MFPWVYGFHWTVYQVVFLGTFIIAAGAIAVMIPAKKNPVGSGQCNYMAKGF